MASAAADFLDLFTYSAASNQQLGEFLREEQLLSESIRAIYSHLLNAHHIWNARILSEAMLFDVWQHHNIESWALLDTKNLEQSLEIIATIPLDQIVGYLNSKGVQFSNTLHEILFHQINHATHHRGQLSAMIRQAGKIPPTMDYIFYKRQTQ
ncbi:MAG: DinB family protein [Leeuwenhoekiella sp.]